MKPIATRRVGRRRCLHNRRVVTAQATDETLRLRRRSFVAVLVTPCRTLRRRERRKLSMKHRAARDHLHGQDQHESFEWHLHPF